MTLYAVASTATYRQIASERRGMFKGNSFARLCILGLAAIARADAAEAPPPANSIVEMFTGLKRCLAPVALAAGTEVTIQFSLNRRGGLIGKPRITYAHW